MGSRSFAASPSCTLFWTNALLLLSGLGKAFGEEYVLVGRFSYAGTSLQLLSSKKGTDMGGWCGRRTHRKQARVSRIGYRGSRLGYRLGGRGGFHMLGRIGELRCGGRRRGRGPCK